jgi:hypothetical protein
MTVISTGCPQCAAGVLEFSRPNRHDLITARCTSCAGRFALSPSGLVWLGLHRDPLPASSGA